MSGEAPGARSTPLICLPFAGAGASFYRKWRPLEPEGVTILPVQLPGREERYNEPPPTDMGEVLNGISAWVLSRIAPGQRVAVFGHSFGASLAYELARRLSVHGVAVARLFVSGAAGPRVPAVERVSELDDAQFLEGVRRVAGYRHPAMDDPGMREVMLPILRADTAMHEDYRSRHAEPAGFPITALRGRDDTLVSAVAAAGWETETSAAFHVRELDGRHMYLTEHPETLLRVIAQELAG